jgi:putative FmdB family regulatory protein
MTMPIFEYECGQCGAKFEVLAASRATRPKAPVCPKCDSTQTGVVMSACAVGRSGQASGAACNVSLGGG